MSLSPFRLAALAAALVAAPGFLGSAHAQQVPAPGDDVVVTLGGGGRVAPDWDGSKTYVLSPMPIVGVKFLRSPFTGQPSSDTGFGL
ncbi:MAG: hypothetical protein GX458_03475, partial [Phyllobacteriaceae bacterium]|nr:hypothetical protein [Phyllobacteriaceae bacterium]